MNDEAPPHSAARSRWTRWRWLIGSAVVAIGIIFFCVFVLWSGDEPAPDVRDLVQKPRALSDDDNAFTVLVRAAQSIDASFWAGEPELFADLARGKAWDSDRAALWVTANSHVWAAVVRAASLPASQGPVIKSLGEVTPQIAPLRQLNDLARVRAWHLFHTGQHQEAFDWLIAYFRAAQRITDSNSTLLIWLMGISAHGGAGQTLEAMIASNAFSPETGRKLIEALEATRPSAAALAKVIGNEQITAKLTVELLQREGGQTSLGGNLLDTMFATARAAPLLFKPHQTERLHAEHLRKIIAQIDSDWPALRATANPHGGDLLGTGWQRVNPDNIAGRVLLGIVTPTLHEILVRRLRAQSAISALQALIGLHLHELEHGTLPEKLSDLVPAYLPKVPRDYYDGVSIRYSREFRAIWSVGKNNLSIASPDPKVDPSEVYLKLPPRNP